MILGVREPTTEALLFTEQTAIKLLNALPVTPISAVGINFGFETSEPPDHLARVFRLADLGQFAEQQLLIEETRILRRIAYDDRAYNLTMALGADGKVRFHANYHAQVDGADAAQVAIRDKTCTYLEHTSKIIADFYGVNESDSDG